MTKHITQKDRENLHWFYTGHQIAALRAERLIALGLMDYKPNGYVGEYIITDSGRAAIQSLIDKATADKLAREAEYDEYDRKEKQLIADLRAKFSEAGVDMTTIEWIGHNWGYGGRPNTFDVDFKMTCAVAFDREEKRYYIAAQKGSTRAIDIDALIREAQDARKVADILNSMLEGEQS